MIKAADKKALIDWDKFVDNMNRAAPIRNQSPLEKIKHREWLEKEGNEEEWFKEFFSKFYTSEPALFHILSTRRILYNPEFLEACIWARELSKTARAMMAAIRLAVTGKKRNIILTSNNFDNAVRLLAPYKSILENNDRLIDYYGEQQNYGNWSAAEFITKQGVAFRAIGAGQSPRGTRNEEIRPDMIIIDDFDTDEDCRNPEIVEQKWDWLERALIPTRAISVPLLIVFCGNIIAEDCCMVRAMEVAKTSPLAHYEIVNIRDEHGKSTWPAKNTEEYIDTALRFLSYKAQQGEYYNNPITEGKVFKEIYYKRMQPLKNYRFVVCYCDPSYKSTRKSDFKAVVLVGKYKHEYHVIKVRCAQTTTAKMLEWHYEMMDYVNGVVPLYMLIEWPWIDEPLKLEIQKYNANNARALPLVPDPRKKPEKYFRIESSLQPINTNGQLFFNELEKGTEHMKAMEAQFKALSPTSRAHDDGPDAVEGAKFVVDSKIANNTSNISTPKRASNPKRF